MFDMQRYMYDTCTLNVFYVKYFKINVSLHLIYLENLYFPTSLFTFNKCVLYITRLRLFVTNVELEVTGFSPDMVMNRFITLHVARMCVYDIGRTHVVIINPFLNVSMSRVDECITLCVYVIIIYEEAGMRAQVHTRRLRAGSL